MTQHATIIHQDGDVINVPLNKLKTSPRNARRMPHAEADIEALAASIAAKGVLQAPVVEPETDENGAATGFYLVTIGEGRRLALARLAKRKTIKTAEPVRCVVDLANDPHEISLDENVTRSGMHPADQFEAFRRLSEERGLSAEEIAARFGVSVQVVRQRLRLGAVSPALMALYRAGELNLDQMMAFAVSEDHARQEQVLEQLGGHRPSYLIRRTMTETKVTATDRRAVFIGAEAYGEAGGTILRDLFTEDGGGWFEDAALLDRLVAEKLTGIAEAVRAKEGWKWAQVHIDYPRALGLARVYPHSVERPDEETAKMSALSDEYDALVSEWDAFEELPPEVEARFAEIDAALEAFGDGTAFDSEEIARGGMFVILGQDGVARVERGLIRPEDVPAIEPEVKPVDADAAATGGEGAFTEPDEAEDAGAPLSERLVLDLTAHRTLALRDALGTSPTVALSAVVHSLALFAFYPPATEAEISSLGSNSFAHLWQDGIPRAADEREPDILRRSRVLVAAARCLREPVQLTASNIAERKASLELTAGEIPAVLNDFQMREVLTEQGGSYTFVLPIFGMWLADVGATQLVADSLSEELAVSALAEENAAIVRSEEVVTLAKSWPTYRGKQIGTDDIRAWYQQVPSPRDQRVLFELLKKVRVFSEAHVRERLRTAHSFVRTAIPVPITRRRNERRTDIVITYVDGDGKSGASYAALYAEENNIAARCIISPDAFKKKFEKHRREFGDVSAIVIIDDIAATGRSLADNIAEFAAQHPSEVSSAKLRAISLVATAEAQERILRRLAKLEGVDADFRACEIVDQSLFAFPEDKSGWASEEEWERARALCVQLGSRIYKQSPLGFGGLGLLVVFPTTVPNNSLPILHSYSRAGAGVPWSPLFLRVVH